MNRFEYVRAGTVAEAIKALAIPNSRALAGGTNLVDLMKYDVACPSRVRSGQRLLGARRHQSHSRDPGRKRLLHCGSSLRHVCGARRPGCLGQCRGSRR